MINLQKKIKPLFPFFVIVILLTILQLFLKEFIVLKNIYSQKLISFVNFFNFLSNFINIYIIVRLLRIFKKNEIEQKIILSSLIIMTLISPILNLIKFLILPLFY